jgi:hypothetical protein
MRLDILKSKFTFVIFLHFNRKKFYDKLSGLKNLTRALRDPRVNARAFYYGGFFNLVAAEPKIDWRRIADDFVEEIKRFALKVSVPVIVALPWYRQDRSIFETQGGEVKLIESTQHFVFAKRKLLFL